MLNLFPFGVSEQKARYRGKTESDQSVTEVTKQVLSTSVFIVNNKPRNLFYRPVAVQHDGLLVGIAYLPGFHAAYIKALEPWMLPGSNTCKVHKWHNSMDGARNLPFSMSFHVRMGPRTFPMLQCTGGHARAM